MKTLEQVATDLNLFAAMTDPVLWLKRQRRAGHIHARKVGRVWMMTAADVDAALEAWAGNPSVQQDQDVPRLGLTAAAECRRVAS